MKGLTISALLAVAVVIAVTPVVSTVYADAYPADPVKSQALALCSAADDGFNRLLATERAACYEQFLPAHPASSAQQSQGRPVHIPTANFVDLWQAQGRGRMAQDDIRFQQQTADSLHELRAEPN